MLTATNREIIRSWSYLLRSGQYKEETLSALAVLKNLVKKDLELVMPSDILEHIHLMDQDGMSFFDIANYIEGLE
jgi:hypothetical protein